MPTLREVRRSDPFFALADPTRRRLLEQLIDGEQTVGHLRRPFSMSQPAVSQHLRILRDAQLVSVRKDGRLHYYRLEASGLRTVRDWLARYEQFWDDRLDALGRYLDDETLEGGA